MAFSKVILNGTTLIDLTADTVDSASALTGRTGHGADGVGFTGTIQDGNNLSYGLTDATVPLVGVGKVGQATLFETVAEIGTAQAGFTVLD